MGQNVENLSKIWRKMVNFRLKIVQNAENMAKNESKMLENGSKMVKNGSKMVDFRLKIVQNVGKYGEKLVKNVKILRLFCVPYTPISEFKGKSSVFWP